MKCVIVCVQWSLALLICLQCVKWMNAAPASTSALGGGGAMPWADVYNRSHCHPMPTSVKISDEYPSDTGDRYNPQCVTLMRCGGCCNDESLECVPTEEFNVTMQIMKTSSFGGSGNGGSDMCEMSFLQHNKCECRPKPTPTPTPSLSPEQTTTREPR
ncbi:VEGF-E [Bovine papular stomatitis virus]